MIWVDRFALQASASGMISIKRCPGLDFLYQCLIKKKLLNFYKACVQERFANLHKYHPNLIRAKDPTLHLENSKPPRSPDADPMLLQ